MKISTIILLISILSLQNNSDMDYNRLEMFLNKVETFFKSQRLKQGEWNMPDYVPQQSDNNMPIYAPYYYDHKTGLQYSPPKGLIIDSKLEMELNVLTGIISDKKTGEQFLLEDFWSKKREKRLKKI